MKVNRPTKAVEPPKLNPVTGRAMRILTAIKFLFNKDMFVMNNPFEEVEENKPEDEWVNDPSSYSTYTSLLEVPTDHVRYNKHGNGKYSVERPGTSDVMCYDGGTCYWTEKMFSSPYYFDKIENAKTAVVNLRAAEAVAIQENVKKELETEIVSFIDGD